MSADIPRRPIKKAGSVLVCFYLAFFALCCQSNGADVLFVDGSNDPSLADDRVRLACGYYGLDIERVILPETYDEKLLNLSKQRDVRAMVIAVQSLSGLDMEGIFSHLKREQVKTVPVLLIGVSPVTDPSILNKWSQGAVVKCLETPGIFEHGFLRVTKSKDIAKELASVDIPLPQERWVHLVLNEGREFHSIMRIADKNDETSFTVFGKTVVEGREVFFQTKMPVARSNKGPVRQYDRDRFFEIAPVMMFLRHAFGERCWHAPGHYANLTIDDPWLTEPYGHLSYGGLLEEMKRHDFHTTIAFIPWNYDRSESQVVSLFRKHPDRFSVCIHGNNHDHYEFYKYETEPGDPWSAKPLDVQEANILQGIARMEQFKRLTGLTYDPVFVFPHAISPAETLGLLKKYNFLATLNDDNVPLGSEEPIDPLFRFRPITLGFENFASLKRYSPGERSQGDIAIDLFLGNYMFFLGHHDLFEDGIDAFNGIVDTISSIAPETEWRGLGYIARQLYVQRLRGDGNYDIRAFSRSIMVRNKHQKTITCFFRKEESFSPPIKQVSVNGRSYPYQKSDNDLSLTITIPPGGSRLIEIEYENDLDPMTVDVSKNDPRVNRLRRLSDFRDITLSKNPLGRVLIDSYYETGVFRLNRSRLTIMLLILIAVGGSSVWYLRKRRKRPRYQKT